MNPSFWEKELYRQYYDLVVVGGGLTGQSLALFFKKNHPDARVLVVERGILPAGASTRNAGFACIGSIGELLADLEIDTEDHLKHRIKARYEGLKLLRSVLGDAPIDYEPCGGWEIFTNYQEFEVAAAEIPRFNGWMEELIGIRDCYRAGSFQQYPAIFNKAEGAPNTGKMMRQLIQLNVNAGVEFRWQTPVTHLDVDAGTIVTEQGFEFYANKLVLATNAFTPRLTGEHSITPGRGYVFVTKALTKQPWQGTFHYNKGYVYFRNIGKDRLLLGGGRNVDYETETTDEFGVNPSIKQYLIQFANDVLRLPDGWEIEQEWSGIMGFTTSKNAQKKWIGEKTLQVAGLSGMGVALAMQLGKSAAEMLD